MKIRSVRINPQKKAFEIQTYSNTRYDFPFVKADPRPGPAERVVRAEVDSELGREAFTYVLESGRSGSVHIEEILEYHQDPAYMRSLLLYKLTLEARRYLEASGLSRREVARRLGTSAAQLYRLLDQTNDRKSIDQMLRLLTVLGCEVDVIVQPRVAAAR